MNDSFELNIPIEIEHYERKIYDLRQLIEISKGLNSTLNYNVLIDSILFTCMGQMQLVQAGIFHHKSISNDNFYLHRNYKGFEVDHDQEHEIKADSPLTSLFREEPRCYTREELESRLDCALYPSLCALQPELIVPLMGKGVLNGIIILAGRITGQPFTEAEKEYMLDIASLAGIAIQNAYLYEMATTDMMTHLKIRHFFETTLMEEIKQTRRANRDLALLMIDIDNFKSFNDTFGHTTGDQVLIGVAQAIREHIRPMDIAARYGGEEFTVILPKTDITEATIVAERIRYAIEHTSVTHNDREHSVTVSIGLTQFDQDRDMNYLAFIDRADRALYESKRLGRNCVTYL